MYSYFNNLTIMDLIFLHKKGLDFMISNGQCLYAKINRKKESVKNG